MEKTLTSALKQDVTEDVHITSPRRKMLLQPNVITRAHRSVWHCTPQPASGEGMQVPSTLPLSVLASTRANRPMMTATRIIRKVAGQNQ